MGAHEPTPGVEIGQAGRTFGQGEIAVFRIAEQRGLADIAVLTQEFFDRFYPVPSGIAVDVGTFNADAARRIHEDPYATDTQSHDAFRQRDIPAAVG